MALISGQLSLPTGEPLVRGTLHFIALENDDDGVVLGVTASFSTGLSGEYSRNIVPGRYRVRISYWPSRGPLVRYRLLGDATVTGDSTLNNLLPVDLE